jgi:hypothetical protein
MIVHKSPPQPSADIPLRLQKMLPVTVSREFDAISPLICLAIDSNDPARVGE